MKLEELNVNELTEQELKNIDGGGFLAWVLGAITALSEGPEYYHYDNGTSIRLTTMSM